jgi:hypothetical protein
LKFIQKKLTKVSYEDLKPENFIHLPKSRHRKVLILDMDETLIHCVDDIHTQNPDVILEIEFEGEETCCAGINLRPFLLESLIEINKYM